MKVCAVVFLALFSISVFAQGEKAPIEEREIEYKNWVFRSVEDDKEIRLSDFLKGKKLVLVVYFAPWCPNWRYQAPFTQKMHEKYESKGFGVIGVGEYDSRKAIEENVKSLNLTFPVVYESDSREARQKTTHYEYRKKAGDKRNWGSPWNIFIDTANLKGDGEILVDRAYVVNGELIEEETEKFIQKKLGLSEESKLERGAKRIEACESDKVPVLRKP
ncbi:MAG: redoxin domain-containing protein [Pyrinomonadaceae bacterium]|nr:redoxin domain-containing protein [Pyrinomonadaceae bacterium]MCX7639578.1 redoxin domain-containing protein [Pyrinomonadaceae bacterium]MDW8303971.1 redoxin domain-containing protein [Acidobacteriota bacterium]